MIKKINIFDFLNLKSAAFLQNFNVLFSYQTIGVGIIIWYMGRPLVKSVYHKINFLISQPKHMLWVLKRTISMRRFFWAPKTYFQTDGLENIYNFRSKFVFI